MIKIEDLEIVEYDFKPINVNKLEDTVNIKNLLSDIKNYYADEINTGNRYAFNVKESNEKYYNITPASKLIPVLSDGKTSLESMTSIIHSIINLTNASNFKLNELSSNNEILNIEFDYKYYSSNDEIKTIILCLVLKIESVHNKMFCINVYKNCDIGYRLLGHSYSLNSFKTSETLNNALNSLCIEDEKG